MNDNTPRQPKNIFEQILFGIESTNDNIVTMSQDLAPMLQKIESVYVKVDEMYSLLFPKTEPNLSGAEKTDVVGEDTI